jgi:hypothetical protein
VRGLDATALVASPSATPALFNETYSLLTELSDRLTQVYFIHSQNTK